MAQQVRSSACDTNIHVRESVRVPAAPLRIQFPTNIPGKAAKSHSISWVTAVPVEDPDGVSGCWLQLGPDLIVATILGVNEQIKDLSLSLSLSLK